MFGLWLPRVTVGAKPLVGLGLLGMILAMYYFGHTWSVWFVHLRHGSRPRPSGLGEVRLWHVCFVTDDLDSWPRPLGLGEVNILV